MNIEKQVASTIQKYKLMKKSDKVVVALSGGKDSTSVIYILKSLGYNVHGLMIDLYLGEWSNIHKKNMTKFCKEQNIPLTIIDLKKEIGQGICFVKAIVAKKKGLTGCTVCGIIKKWILNRWARKLEADVIVTGHNLDDEAQNVLMNFLKGNVMLGAGMGPKTGTKGSTINKLEANFVQRVKPLFFTAEDEIRSYAKKKKFDILYDKCPCSFETYRADTRDWTDALSNTEKLKIVQGFLDVANKMKDDGRKAQKCSECGEVSRDNLCSYCKIMKDM